MAALAQQLVRQQRLLEQLLQLAFHQQKQMR
jgi:hypothetical protein